MTPAPTPARTSTSPCPTRSKTESQTHSPPAHSPAFGGQLSPESPHSCCETPRSIASPRLTAFQASGLKTRLIGLSHWMAPCREMFVIGALLDRSSGFQSARTAFDELKALLQTQESMHSGLPTSQLTDGSTLRLLLPDRDSCEAWASQFCRTYNRIYSVIDPVALASDMDRIYEGSLNSPVHIARLLLVTAIGMQDSEVERARGRALATQVETCIHTSLRFQKPCIGAVQNLILLMVLKTISGSDTDKIFDLMALQGLTSQILSNMGLHRDPALFPEVTPYYAEVRRRLWACFVRLSLEYSIRSGSQLNIRLDESDCPLPAPTSLRHLRPAMLHNASTNQDEERDVSDAVFAVAAARLANTIVPVYQSLHSPNPPDINLLQSKLRASFGALTTELPAALRLRAETCDPVVELQQSVLAITMQSFLAIITLGHTLGKPTEPSDRSQLMETWDHATSVMHQFQNFCQTRQQLREMACHLLWADVNRAALTACWLVGRLRRLDHGSFLSDSNPQQTLCVFQRLLIESLSFLSRLWHTRFYLGPVAAKVNLILAVALKTSENLDSADYHPVSVEQTLFREAVMAAEKVVDDMKFSLQRRQPLLTPTPTDFSASPVAMDTSLPTWKVSGPVVGDLPSYELDGPLFGPDLFNFDFNPDNSFPSMLPNFTFPVDDDMFGASGASASGGPLLGSLWE